MGSGVVCPACVQPQFDEGIRSASPVATCKLCAGQGIVSVQREIAWLKENKVGCYADPPPGRPRRQPQPWDGLDLLGRWRHVNARAAIVDLAFPPDEKSPNK